jgi:hypothetical protein
MEVELVGSLKTQFVPGDDTLEQCRALGERIGERIAYRVGATV